MEEKKKAKEIKMNANANAEAPKERKLSYEQLNDVCQQLFQQNQQLRTRVTELDNVMMFKRLDYLFKAVELASTFKDSDFINSCMDEIKEALTVKEEKSENNNIKD